VATLKNKIRRCRSAGGASQASQSSPLAGTLFLLKPFLSLEARLGAKVRARCDMPSLIFTLSGIRCERVESPHQWRTV